MLKLTPAILREFQEAYQKDIGVLLPLPEIEIKVRQFAEVLKIISRPFLREDFLLWWERTIGPRAEGERFLQTRTRPHYPNQS